MDISNDITNLGCNVIHIKQGHIAKVGGMYFTETNEVFRLGRNEPSVERVAQFVAARINNSYQGLMVTIRDVELVLRGGEWVAYTAIGKQES